MDISPLVCLGSCVSLYTVFVNNALTASIYIYMSPGIRAKDEVAAMLPYLKFQVNRKALQYTWSGTEMSHQIILIARKRGGKRNKVAELGMLWFCGEV